MSTVNVNEIKEHAQVIAVCGTKVGDVDHVQGSDIKLTKHGDGKHHLIPTAWIADIRDGQLHLSKDATEVTSQWTTIDE